MNRRILRLLPIATAAALLLSRPAFAADLVNVAPFGTATQSTDYNAALYPASAALDGNYTAGSFTHTNGGDPAPAWQVDLGKDYAIDKIVLWNRVGCCPERLRDITVWILDGDGATVLYESALLNPLNEDIGPPTIEVDLALEEGGPISGQIVRVTRTPDPTGGQNEHDASVISLAEVEVFVDSSTLPPAIQTQPVGGKKYTGGCHVFSVTLFNAEGAASITYEWFKDTTKIAGETRPRLILANLQPDDAGTYEVVVKVDATTLTSDPAVLEVGPPNLALGGTATQSSLAFGGPPERAIDGNTSGVWANGSITHTDNLPDGWWQVELYGTSTVDTVVLWNRLATDCCPERLQNFRVSALDDEGIEVFGEDYFTDLVAYPDPSLEVDLGGVECRTIKVSKLGPDASGTYYLSLAEVEVFGEGPSAPPDPRPNLARGCGVLATQSSTNGAYVADLAINGNLADFTHTVNTDLTPSWQVDLASESDLAVIVLHNRTSCCGSRLRDITVSILDAGGDLVWASDLLNPENELGAFPNGPASLTVNLLELEGNPIKGQIVRVTREPDPDFSGGGDGTNQDEAYVISLGEVEVFGYPSDCPAAGDTHCQGLAVAGPAGSYPGLYTFTATATDDSGDAILYTFTLDNGIDPPTVVGPQAGNVVSRRLGPGDWSVSVAVDDDPVCIDKAADAACAPQSFEVLDVENVAPLGAATQSTEGGFAASNAIDGIYDIGNFTHTDVADPASWWQVDLLSEQTIGRIVLFNREGADCCGSRLRDITVSILDAVGDVLWESELLNPENEGFEFPHGPPTITVDIEAEEGGGIDGQIVRVTRTRDDDLSGSGGLGNNGEPGVLSLMEVEVYPATGVVPKPRFRRGDANADASVNITDGIYVLNFLFLGGETPTCQEAADSNDDGAVNITDGIHILNFLFLGGEDPRPPGPTDCGSDPPGSPTEPGCVSYGSC